MEFDDFEMQCPCVCFCGRVFLLESGCLDPRMRNGSLCCQRCYDQWHSDNVDEDPDA